MRYRFNTLSMLKITLVILLSALSSISCSDSTKAPAVFYEDGILVDSKGRLNITQYGITWTFDREYPRGQFVNGDYYIIGPAQLLSVYPLPRKGRNGSMVNPSVGPGQGYDSRANDYDASLAISLPRTLNPGESLVSTISNPEYKSGTLLKDFAGLDVDSRHAKLKAAAVLTCLDADPGSGTFRPSYMGTVKTLYSFNGSAGSLLPALAQDISAIESYGYETAYDYYIRGLKRPWIIHPVNYTARYVHPLDNMKNYHADLDKFFGEASLLLMIDPGQLTQKREDLLMYYLQTGIDYYHMCILGAGDFAFNIWPVVFTGLVLNEPGMYNVFVDHRNKYDPKEYLQTYFLSDRTSSRTSSILAGGNLWTGYVHPVTGTRPAWRQDTGNAEHEHLHPSEWTGCGDEPGGAKRESYRRINSPLFAAYALCALIYDRHSALDIRSLFDHDAFFDYTDRWMNEDMTASCETYNTYWGYWAGNVYPGDYQYASTSFVTSMWVQYRDDY